MLEEYSGKAAASQEKEVSSVLTKVFTVETSTESIRYSYALCTLILDTGGCNGLRQYGILNEIKKATADRASGVTRESAFNLLGALFEQFPPKERVSEIIFLRHDRGGLVACALDGLADKGSVVREAAQYALDALFHNLGCEAKVVGLLPALLRYLSNSAARWQGVVGALKMVQKLFNAAKPSIATTVTDGGDGSFLQAAVSAKFAEVIPALENRMHDLKAEVKKQARHTMHDFAYLLSNQDIAAKIPLLIEAMHHPSANSLQAAISALSQTTFVATVTAPVLALIAPLLQRSLANTTTPQEMVRQTLTIVENVVKLVHDPAEARTFALGLKPGVKRAVGQAALPEVRAVATNVQTVIEDVVSIASDVSKVTAEDIARVIDANVKNLDADVTGRNEYTSMRQYVGELVALDVYLDQPRRIASVVSPYIAFFCQIPDALDIAAAVQGFFVRQHDGEHDEPEEEEIVNANFSLGYGGSLLLSQTNLRILRGHKYGVTGRNGVGKSTLLKAIAEGKLEGLPPPGTLRTCLVDYSQNHNESSSVFSYISSESDLIKGGEKRISALLTHYGLTVEDQTRPVSSLSGGNRMKLNLIKAIIKEPDILLLDEPTNHLDEANVEWLVRFLKGNTTSTCLIVSHDPSFLKAVATDYYHFGPYKKLKHFTSSLAAVSEVFPEVRQHDTLLNTSICFTFPAPTILTGVKSPTRTILRMKNVSYTYPESLRPALKGISCQLSLSSRVSISGRNGAGKSSLVKLMTEEMVPTSGQVEAHPNLRIGYIKQDSLEHVEMHEDKTANQYILWRYAYGDDREVFTKQSRFLSAADRAHLSQPVDIGDGKGPRQIETLVGRQKHLRSFKYEVKWQGWLPKYNTFLTRETLFKNGFQKSVQAFDDYERSRQGLEYRELSPTVVSKHLQEFSLDTEAANHTLIGSLSGGQKVKVVFAAALWTKPHILVLDEPTNFLDCDSLQALSLATADFKGGVVIISHDDKFARELTAEQWVIENGELVSRGTTRTNPTERTLVVAAGVGTSEELATATAEMGRLRFKDNKKKKLTRHEIKERETRRRLRHIEWLASPKGTPRPEDTDDE